MKSSSDDHFAANRAIMHRLFTKIGLQGANDKFLKAAFKHRIEINPDGRDTSTHIGITYRTRMATVATDNASSIEDLVKLFKGTGGSILANINNGFARH